MAALFSQLSQTLADRMADQMVLLVPPQAFFTLPTEVPADLPAKEWTAFAELTLESHAPFPLDQLAWGFWRDEAARRLLIYAAPLARLRKLGLEDVETAHYDFPGFLLLGAPAVTRPTLRFVAQSGGIAALFLQPGATVPEKVVARPIVADILTDDAIWRARQDLVKSLGSLPDDLIVEETVWTGEGVTIEGDKALQWHFRHVTADGPLETAPLTTQLPSEQAWEMDLREVTFAQKTARERKMGRWVWFSYVAAAVTILLLLLSQGVLWGFGLYLEQEQNRITAQQENVFRIQATSTLAERLVQSTERGLEAFTMLQAVNLHRPDEVYFDEVASREFNVLETEGLSTTGVEAVNAFAGRLRDQAFVDEVIVSTRTRNAETTFEMAVRFNALPEVVLLAESDEAEATNEEDDS